MSALCDLASDSAEPPWFTTQQIESFVAMIDGVFVDHCIAPPSSRLDEFLLCRTIALCAVEHPRLEIRRCRDDALRTLLARFEANTALLPLSDG